MKTEALKFIADLVLAGNKVQDLVSDAEFERQLISGKVTEFPTRITPRSHQVKVLDEVIALATRFSPGTEEAPGDDEFGFKSVVWYNEQGVTLVLDDDARRENTATLKLAFSDVFQVVMGLRQQKPWFDQAEFIMLLRVDLAGTLDPDVLLNRIRRIDLTKTGTSTIKRGEESMGTSIISQTSGKDATPPEEVSLRLPVFKTPGERSPVYLNCTVDFEVSRQKPFRLLPMPDELERVQAERMADIAARLTAGLPESVPAYYGSP
jgi:hypothetical protein